MLIHQKTSCRQRTSDTRNALSFWEIICETDPLEKTVGEFLGRVERHQIQKVKNSHDDLSLAGSPKPCLRCRIHFFVPYSLTLNEKKVQVERPRTCSADTVRIRARIVHTSFVMNGDIRVLNRMRVKIVSIEQPIRQI